MINMNDSGSGSGVDGEVLAYAAVGRQLTNLAGENERLRMELKRIIEICREQQGELNEMKEGEKVDGA